MDIRAHISDVVLFHILTVLFSLLATILAAPAGQMTECRVFLFCFFGISAFNKLYDQTNVQYSRVT